MKKYIAIFCFLFVLYYFVVLEGTKSKRAEKERNLCAEVRRFQILESGPGFVGNAE